MNRKNEHKGRRLEQNLPDWLEEALAAYAQNVRSRPHEIQSQPVSEMFRERCRQTALAALASKVGRDSVARTKRPSVILADDHAILVEAFRKLLEPHFKVVGTVSDGRALLETAKQLNPDVIVVDIGMPLMNGLEVGLRLKDQMPAVKLIFLTMNEDASLALEAMRCGASGYLLKSCATTELIRAIEMSLKGKSYVTPQIARGLGKAFICNPSPKQRAKVLTPRQREVVKLLVEGKSKTEVASILNVTPRTVAFHTYRIMQDLDIGTTAELILLAMKSKTLLS